MKKVNKIKWCKCGDGTRNKDGVCDTCKMLDEMDENGKKTNN
jgi:hypothetical protein